MSIYVAPRAVKAGPIGSGAGVLLTEYPLFSFLAQDPHQKMRTAYQVGMNTPWIRRAEMVIGSKVATVDFDLDDPKDMEIDLAYPSEGAVAAWLLLNRPQAELGIGAPMSRSQLWRLTSRHIGLAGNAFWLQDSPEAFSGTPKALAYIRPDRMTPKEDANGNLIEWRIDERAGRPGIAVSLEQVVHFMLEPPESGHLGAGLVETALLMAQLSGGLSRHLASVISAGGRISGFLSPKTGVIPGETMKQMERDWRSITEQPDAAKRLQLIAAPVEFQTNTLTPDQLDLAKLMELMRDDLLSFWNVPGSLVGISHAVGLNSGDSRKYDEAALWQGPVHDRLNIIYEGISDKILTRYEKWIGWVPKLVIEEPKFDDDSPRYDLLGKSINIAMRNRERRELVGLEPFGDATLDDAVWMPATMVPAFSAASEGTEQQQEQEPGPTRAVPAEPVGDAAMQAAGETTLGKANLAARVMPLRQSLIAVRDSIETYHTPRIRQAVATFLDEQRRDIAQRIRSHADAIIRKPRDTSVWWDGKRWDTALAATLTGGLAGMAASVSRQVSAALPPIKANPIGGTVVDHVLRRGAARVTKINQATRDEIAAILAEGIDAGAGLLDIADAIEAGTDLTPLIGRSGGVVADTAYRAEMIARTELMGAYNAAALYSYSDAGVSLVQAIDGDKDEVCADRNGREFPIAEADGIDDHPNGTLDWVPVFGDTQFGKADLVMQLAEAVKADHEITQATLQRSLREVTKAMLAQAERPMDPVVVPAPAVNVEPVDLSALAAAFDRLSESIRNQPPAPTPIVNIPSPALTRKVVERDALGQIVEIREEII